MPYLTSDFGLNLLAQLKISSVTFADVKDE